MENATYLTTETNFWAYGISLLTLILGLVIGLRFRQVICKTLIPVIHKYNIHHLIPVKEVDSDTDKEEEVEKEVEKVD
tara:strand:+ start:283 stop:516 length:234 start_codon:yes stop_codon:yes gene_type:complete